MPLITTVTHNKSDLFGALASGLCMVHCLATPLLFVVQASASCSEVGPLWWRTLDYIFLVVSILAIYQSTRTTTLSWMPKAMYAAWSVLAFLIISKGLHLLSIPHAFMYLPAFSLVGLHLYNQKYCRCTIEQCYSAE